MDIISQLSESAAGWLVDEATEQSGEGASKLTVVSGKLTETATGGMFTLPAPAAACQWTMPKPSVRLSPHLGSLVVRVPAGTLDQSIDLDLRLDEVLITGSSQDQISATLTTTEVIDGVITCRANLNNRHDTAQRQADPLHADDVGNIDSHSDPFGGIGGFFGRRPDRHRGCNQRFHQDQPNGIHGSVHADSSEQRQWKRDH